MKTTNFLVSEIVKKVFPAGLYCLAVLSLLAAQSDLALAQSRPSSPRSPQTSNASVQVPVPAMDPAVRPIHRNTQSNNETKRNSIDWTTLPSTYTHDMAGQRVDQHSQGIEPVVFERPDYTKSGFRHSRSSLQTGFSSDHYHTVEQWGPEIRPYGEWRYPARPFSVPYNVWGPQLPLAVGGGWGVPWNVAPGIVGAPGVVGGNAVPQNGNLVPGNQQPNPPGFQNNPGLNFGVGPANALRPMQDEYYPPAPIYYPPANGLR